MRKSSQGLTLIELLLALGIFSILALLAYGGINGVLNTRQAVNQESTRLAALQRSFVRLARDFEQVSPRAIRDGYGDVQPALYTSTEIYKYKHKDSQADVVKERKARVLVEFTVAGRRILPGQKRSSLQRIAYAIDGNKLLRLNWAVLDRAQDSQPYVSVILNDIEKLTFRFLKADGEWLESWTFDEAGLQTLPAAIEIRFADKKFGKLRRVFLVS